MASRRASRGLVVRCWCAEIGQRCSQDGIGLIADDAMKSKIAAPGAA